MKKLAITLFAVSSISSIAAELNLPPPPTGPLPPPALGVQFADGIKIQEFAKVVLNDVLKSQYVFSSDFLADTSYVAFSAKSLKSTGSEALLRDVLAQHNYTIVKKDNYYRIYKTRESDGPDLRQDFVYRLKYRDLAYISSQLQPLFSDGSFTHDRALKSGPGHSTSSGGQASSKRPVDDGKSLYSMSQSSASDLLIFRGLPVDIERLKYFLAELDVPVPRVLVRAIILETRNIEQSGYSVSGVASLLSGKLGIQLSSAIAGSNSLSFSAPNFDAVLSALQGDSSVKVLTAPSVYAETNAEASLAVGASVPTLGAIQFDGNGKSQQSVEYRDTGVQLKVTPRIFDGSISLTVNQEISDAVQTQTGVSGSPTITKSALSTVLNLKSGDSVILGGLSSDKSSIARDSLPVWRQLTLGNTESTSKSDIVIILYAERS